MKITKAVFGIITISLALTGQVQAQSFLTNGLVAFYPFNGNANDASGNGHNGTNINATLAPDRFGLPNACYLFNGTNSHVDIGTSIQLGNPHDAMTVSVWFLLTNTLNPQFNYTAALWSDYTDARPFFGELDFLNWAQFTNQLAFYGPPSPIGCPAVVNDNRWHSCTVVVDGQGTISMYVDGALSSQSAYDSSINYFDPQDFWRIGAELWRDQIWNVFNGFIDDVRFYNRALSSSEVAQLYAYESGPRVNLIKAVKPSFSNLHLGTSYQLQVSADLNTWTNQGAAFTATSLNMVYPQYFDVDNWGELFFRLEVAP